MSHIARPTITDVCLITRNLDEGIAFYTEKLGFTLNSVMPGFADFRGPGVILALWDAETLEAATGVPGRPADSSGHGVMLACELDSPADIDAVYEEYVSRGVEFYGPPKDYPWNARCIYFAGPTGEFWEFFAWHDGGIPGLVHSDGAASDGPAA